MKTFKQLLTELNACDSGLKWMGDRTVEEYMTDAERGDWVLWLGKKLDLPLNKMTLAKARCAKTVIHLMKDERSINAVNIAERFGLDECTLEELHAAAAAAADADADADADAAAAAAADADAADADADAAYAAYAAAAAAADADAAADAAYAAAADADAAAAAAADAADADAAYAAYAAADAACKKNQQQTADICVEILGDLIVEKVNQLLNK